MILSNIITYFNKKNSVKVKLTEIHKADILKTHGCNKKLTKTISKIKYSDFYDTFYRTDKTHFFQRSLK